MEEMYWEQFLKTGTIVDYLRYRNILEEDITKRNVSGNIMNPESEGAIESDYSDRNGASGIAYR